MWNKRHDHGEKGLLILSCAAALLLTTPAWKQGILFVALAVLLTTVLILRTNVHNIYIYISVFTEAGVFRIFSGRNWMQHWLRL